MTPEQWKEFSPYFTPKECGEGMDYGFMLSVLELRHALGIPMHVHAGIEKAGHAKKSYHITGHALDFHCDNTSPRHIMAEIDRIGKFGGAGFYPWWNNPGFHIDCRPLSIYQRWLSPKQGQYIYLMGGAV